MHVFHWFSTLKTWVSWHSDEASGQAVGSKHLPRWFFGFAASHGRRQKRCWWNIRRKNSTESGWKFGTWLLFFHTLIYIFGNNHPNWQTHIFQRGRYTTNQLRINIWADIMWQIGDDHNPPSAWCLRTDGPSTHGIGAARVFQTKSCWVTRLQIPGNPSSWNRTRDLKIAKKSTCFFS